MITSIIITFICQVLSLMALCFSAVGILIFCIGLFFKVQNYAGTSFRQTFPHPKAYLMIFIGSLMFSVSNICMGKVWPFVTQLLISGLYLCIYILHSKTYSRVLENENR